MSRTPQTPLDRIAADCAAEVYEEVQSLAFNAGLECDSPIETVFFHAMMAYIRFVNYQFGLTLFERGVAMDEKKTLETRLPWQTPLAIARQIKITDYPVDFLISVQAENGVWRHLVVECDGHDFHERTKEQAARDRSRERELQIAGYCIIRFTGSELWKNPLACAKQAVELLDTFCVVKP